jgi:hypothetical protein
MLQAIEVRRVPQGRVDGGAWRHFGVWVCHAGKPHTQLACHAAA